MTKSLKTLIRLAKKEVEKEQETLANLQARYDKFAAQRDDWLAKIAKEAAAVEQFPEFAADFGDFAKAAQDKIKMLEVEMAKLDKRVEKQRDKLREAFAEQKKYEIALETKEAEVFEEEKKTEQKGYDEIAVQRHSRD